MVGWALTAYSIGLAGYAAIKVLSPAFYALDDAKTPMYVSLASIAIHVVTSFGMMQLLSTVGKSAERPNGYGHAGVALATSIVALINFIALTLLMRRRIRRINGRDIFSSIARVLIASAAMSAVAYGTYYFLHQRLEAATLINRLVETFIPIALAGVVFLGAAKLLGVTEIEKIYQMFARKLGGRK